MPFPQQSQNENRFMSKLEPGSVKSMIFRGFIQAPPPGTQFLNVRS